MLVPSRRGRAALFIALLGGGVLLVVCSASPSPAGVPTTPGASVLGTAPVAGSPSPSLPSPSLGDTPPPLNRLEVKVIDTLARLGVTSQRAELPFNNAAIWAQFGTGSQLFVNAWPTGTDRGEFSVIDERQLEGTRVQRVQYAGSPPPRHRFECSGDTYEVSGAVPPGFTDMDAFVARFIRALGCGV